MPQKQIPEPDIIFSNDVKKPKITRVQVLMIILLCLLAPIVYYRSDLERIVGVRLKETASSIEGITAKQYYSNGSETTEYDRDAEAKRIIKLVTENL